MRAEECLRNAARYVVANLLRAGLCHRIGDYPHRDAAWLYERDFLPQEPVYGQVLERRP